MYNCKYTLCKHRANRGAASLFRLLCGPRAHVRLSGSTPDPRAGPSSAAGPPCALEGQWMRPLRHGTSNTRAGPSSAVGPACSMEGTPGLARPLRWHQPVRWRGHSGWPVLCCQATLCIGGPVDEASQARRLRHSGWPILCRGAALCVGRSVDEASQAWYFQHSGWPVLCSGASLFDGGDTRAGPSSVSGPTCALWGQ